MVLDNLSVHQAKRVRDFAQSRNFELVYNDVYSSEYNPIERLFAITNSIVRKKLL